MRRKSSFINIIQVWAIVFLIGLGTSFVIIDVIGAYRDFSFQADHIREDYIGRQKQIIRQEVERVVDMIRYEKAQSEELTRREIQSRVLEAHAVAQNIYRQNRGDANRVEIPRMIVDALRPIRFANGSGYYFITRMDGVEILFADRPQMEGLNLLDMKDTRGLPVIRNLIDISRQYGQGFLEYHWTKPGAAGNDFKKISFVKRFEPYDWIIGAGLYVDDVAHQIETDLLSAISRIRFGQEGYIFVNTLNGDALVSNGRIFSGTQKLWEVFDDDPEKMKNVFDKEHQAALKPEGDFIEYSHIKLTTPEKESQKLSFVRGIPELGWLVGAGLYLDDIETNIASMQAELNDQIKSKLFYFILTAVVIVAIFLFCFNWLNQRLKSDISLFISFFKRAANSDREIERSHIRFVELDQMAEYANKMMADRKRAEESLAESEAKYRSMMESMTDPVYICSPDFKVAYMNPVMIARVGRDATGEPCYRALHDLDGKCAWCVSDEIRRGNPVEINVVSPKDGRHYRVNSMPIHNPDGTVSKLTIYQDITDYMRAIHDKERVTAQLQQAQKLESIGNLAGGIAHDFNNLLSSIIGYTELALDDVSTGSPLEDHLREVYAAGIRASDLVKQILAFARRSDEALKPIQTGAVVREVLKLMRSTIPTTIEIRQRIESDAVIMGNPSQVHQVFMNLCTNAAQAMEDAGGVLEVVLEEVVFDERAHTPLPSLRPGNYLKATVSDTGKGIDPEIVDSVFEPYFTTKPTGEGTGLGLSLVHGIVESYGGKIHVESQPGKGATFTVYLPTTKTPDRQRGPTDEHLPSGTERILLVDDEVPIAKVAGRVLDRLGYDVTVFTRSAEALERFRSKPGDFDLVITDMTMPGMTGDRLALALMKLRPDIPVILCTGFSKQISDETASAIGIKAFLYKPIAKADLARTVREVLDDARKTALMANCEP